MLRNSILLVACFLLIGAPAAFGATIDWTDWTAATPGNPGSAVGTITSHGITVSYSGEVGAAQTAGGTDYWNSAPTPYLVPNAPPDSDIIRLWDGSSNVLNTITFSKPVLNPVMAILSLGQPAYPVRYDFDTPFNVILSGRGHWGGNPAGSLFEEPGDVLLGIEGHGVIQFPGAISSFSWIDQPGEYWHGFTVGIAGLPGPSAVPLPNSLLLGAFGLLGLALLRRRRG